MQCHLLNFIIITQITTQRSCKCNKGEKQHRMGILRGGFGVIVIVAGLLCVLGNECGRMVGGRSEVKDVASNEKVQELGRFVVEEYKRRTSLGKKGREEVRGLKFAEVVKAEKQVVSGLKYYLKVAVVDKDGERKLFDSVVVVKPWERSKQLVRFTPSGSDNYYNLSVE